MQRTLLLLCSFVLFSSARLPAQSSSAAQGPVVLGGLGSGAGATFRPFHPGIEGLPFSLTQTNTRVQTLADGTHITTTMLQRKMRDAEGRTRTESLSVGQGGALGGEHVEISDPVARMYVRLIASTKTAYTTHLGERPIPTPAQQAALAEARAKAQANGAKPPFSARPKPERQVERLGSQTIAGVYVEGTRTVQIFPAGMAGSDRELRTVEEVWTSPDLHIDLERISDDPRMGKTTLLVTGLERISPDPLLFRVPADYTVVDHPAGITPD